jgi:hypothetical protein
MASRRTTYAGLADPLRDFADLEPAFEKLMRMAQAYHPADAQHAALVHAAMTMRTAAELITRQPHYRGVGSTDGAQIIQGFKG